MKWLFPPLFRHTKSSWLPCILKIVVEICHTYQNGLLLVASILKFTIFLFIWAHMTIKLPTWHFIYDLYHQNTASSGLFQTWLSHLFTNYILSNQNYYTQIVTAMVKLNKIQISSCRFFIKQLEYVKKGPEHANPLCVLMVSPPQMPVPLKHM